MTLDQLVGGHSEHKVLVIDGCLFWLWLGWHIISALLTPY